MAAAQDESFFLTKNNYEESTKSIFKSLLTDVEFTDVTLACSDNKQVKGHKAILGASSSFFRNIFQRNSATNLVLYLKGITQKDLCSIMEFIYMGQTSVNKVDLTTFLEAAEELKIEGLIQPSKQDTSVPEETIDNTPKMHHYQSVPEITIDESGSISNEEFSSATDGYSSTSGGYSSSNYTSTNSMSSTMIDTSMLDSSTNLDSHNDSTELTFSVTPEFSSTMIPLTPAPAPVPSVHPTEECTECGAKFSDPGNLKRHISAAHVRKQTERNGSTIRFDADTQKYYCNMCVFSSVHRRSANRHVDSVHAAERQQANITSGEEVFNCNPCNRSFNLEENLKRHNAVKHRPGNIKEEGADLSIESDANVSDMNESSDLDEKKRKCLHCEFSTNHRSSLMRHMATLHGVDIKKEESNSGPKKYSCFSCDFSTDHSSSLKRHIETLHQDKVNTEAEPNISLA